MTPEAPIVPPRRSKLRPPRLAHDLVSRPRLLERLDRLATLSLIVAPAGYGKTTLVSMWLTQIDLPSAWVSLDEEDNEPSYFLTDFISAIRTVFPNFGDAILERLNSPRGRPFPDLVTNVINELNLLDGEFVLVLDDYHWVHDPAIHQLLVQLLTHPPRAIHLVIAARHDPPLPWHLRARGYLCEIRARDLSFTQTEAAELLAKAAERPIPAATAKALTEQAEGWATSLRLAALNVRRQPQTNEWPSVLNGNQRNFVEYFASEVIAYLPASTSDFLLRTSILDALNGGLCDFVAGDAPPEGRGSALLRQLETDGVFIIALDEEGTWFRLHPLLKHALQHTLQQAYAADEVARLYERAVAWNEEQGLLEEAIHYALSNQQIATAVGVVHRHRQQLLDALDFPRLDRWLRQFPLSAIGAYPDLLLSKAWLMHIRFEMLDVRDCLEQIETLLAASNTDEQLVREWEGEVAALRSVLYVNAGDPHKAALAGQRALENTPRSLFYIRTIALVYVTFALHMAGESAFIESLLGDAAADPWIARDLAILRVQQVRHFVQLIAADLYAMQAGFPKLLQMATARGFKPIIAWAHYYWGCASYLQNHLDDADEHFGAVVELADYANAVTYTHSVIGLALTRQAQGAPHEATAVVESARTYLRQMQLDQMLQVINAFAADLAVRQGSSEDGTRWLARNGRDLLVEATPMFYVPGLAPVKVLIDAGTDENLAAAQAWLTRVSTIAVRTRNTHMEIQALALQAVLSAAQGNRQQALAALGRALALAEPGGAVRVFADLSSQLASLLKELQSDVAAPEFLWQVRSAVENDLEIGRIAAPPVSLGQAMLAPAENRDLRLVLTYREMDVLRLLDQRLTNKEIARQLGISTETVRQHTVKLYRKLHVENRRQAIVVARAMGYFDA